MPAMMTPTTKPTPATIDVPAMNLPPSLPKQSYLGDMTDQEPPQFDPFGQPSSVRRGSVWLEQNKPRSLTNNQHSAIPQSFSGGDGGIKMGQSPTILSILSSTEQTHVPNNGMSYKQGSSMIASSRTYVSTTVPQQHDNYAQPPHLGYQYMDDQNNQNNQYALEDDDDEDDDGEFVETEHLQFDFE